MVRNDLTTGWVRARQRAVRRRVHQTIEQTVDGPLVTPTHQYVSDIPPGLASVVAQISAEVAGRDWTSEEVLSVGTAVAFVNLHLQIHASATHDGDSDAILAGDLVRALVDRTICRSPLSSETVEAVSTACLAASKRGLSKYYRTGDPAAIEPSTFVDASRAGAALSSAEWVPSFVASVSKEGSHSPGAVVPADFEDDVRIMLLERIASGDVP